MAQGLAVRHDAPTRDWFGTIDGHWPSATTPASTGRSRRHTESDGGQPPMSHKTSASNLVNDTKMSLASHNVHNRSASYLLDGGKRKQRSAAQSQTRSQEIAELVDFLNNYKPPLESWTSQPFDDEGRGRWSRLKNMGGFVKRSKSVPKTTRPIRLPDSAVCGTTTGGHRHIAISIPMEASPFGLMPRTQYPVYHNTVDKRLLDPVSSVRYLNEKGAITVLRPAVEANHSHQSRGSFPGFRLSVPPPPGPPPSKALPQTGSGLARSKSNTTSLDSFGESPVVHQFKQQVEIRPELRSSNAAAAPPRRTSSAHGLYPHKASHSMHRSARARPSIDGIIAETSANPAGPATANKNRPISESSATEDEEPILGAVKHWPHLRQGSSGTIRDKAAKDIKAEKCVGTTLISENPLATMDEQDTPPVTPCTPESRRDKVRHLKRRDMASVRSSLRRQDSECGSPPENTAEHVDQPPQACDSSKSTKYTPTNTLSPIMVVTSIEPIEIPTVKPAWKDRKRRDLEITPPGSGFITKVEKTAALNNGEPINEGEPSRTQSLTLPQTRRARAIASLSPLTVRKSCNPTPPMSPIRGPRRANSTLDRTSLSRRREWNASKCKARRVQDVVDAVKSKIQDDNKLIEALKEVQAADRDQEFLKLYEAYREHRLRDMERRVRRLERNGDVWMRALVPVLDNLNRTMVSAHYDSKEDDMSEWKSDDEINEGPHRGRTKHRSLPIYSQHKNSANPRRVSTLADRKGTDAAHDDGEDKDDSLRDSDDSGLDNLEPLMRELAGAAQERLQKTERLTGVAL